jgi:hypothetical protein
MTIPMLNESKIIYSLFDYSGNWSQPYVDADYDVRRVDLKYGDDVRLLEIPKTPVYGILAAPVCTSFAGCGAQYWPAKDADGRTLQGLELVGAACRFILSCNPEGFWVIENPVGRLNRWIGKPRFYFNPCDYGDAYTKKTALWGRFNIPVKNPVEPVRVCSQGSWVQKLGGGDREDKGIAEYDTDGIREGFL